MKFLIAGFGSIGRRHFRNLKALGESDFVFFRSKLSTLPDDEIERFPVEYKLDAAFGHKPDVVIVSNPTALHLDIAIPAAERGCCLFIEKPISHSLEGIDRLREVATRSGIKVLVGFQFRFHPQLVQIKQLLNQQAIGQIISVRVEWGEYLPDWHPWEDFRRGYSARKALGGGVVLTLSHPLDYLHWLIGEVDSLWSFTDNVETLGIDVEGVAEIGFRFINGVIGSLHLDFIQRPHAHHMEIIGSEGKIQWDYLKGSLCVYKGSIKTPETYPLPADFERNWMFSDQMAHLIELVKNKEDSKCTLIDGIIAQKLAFGVHESAKTRKIYQLRKN